MCSNRAGWYGPYFPYQKRWRNRGKLFRGEVRFNLAQEPYGILQNLAIANGNKPINSQETITAESPYTKNAKQEIATMKKEEKEMAQNSNPFGATFPANPDE